MEICKMLKEGKAYEIFLSKQIAEQMTKITGEKYDEGEKMTLCEVGDHCLHGGKQIYDARRKEGASDLVSICKSKGEVD